MSGWIHVAVVVWFQCMEGDESSEAGDWPTKMKNCVTDEERIQIDECFNDRSTALLLKVGQEGVD